MNTLQERARKIIHDILYITIATYSFKERKPWVTPVYSGYDEHYNFFWISGRDTQHSRNLRDNNEIAIVIYDSRAPEGTGEGVYMEALGFELTDEKEIAHAIPYLFDRINKPHRDVFDFVDSVPVRIYKAIPQKIWMNNSEKIGSHDVDARIEVNLFS